MSSIIPIAKTVAKKITPKSKKGKVIAGTAVVGGIAATRNKEPESKTTALTPSQEAQGSNPPAGQGEGSTLLNLPLGTQIRTGTSGFLGVPYKLGYSEGTYTTASAVKGDAEKLLATKTAPQKAALLIRLGQIPALYSKGYAPTSSYVQGMGNSIIWRPEDAKALESILFVQDQLGDPTADITLSNLISNPTLSSRFFGRITPAAKAVSDPAALKAELDDKFLDIFESKADKNLSKSYAAEINALELKGTLGSQQREDILLKYIQRKATEQYNLGETGTIPGVGVSDKGSLGRRVRALRTAYDDNGIPINEKQIYSNAVESLRSQEAYQNEIDAVTMQAGILMPAFKDLFAKGKTGRNVLSPYISIKSQITGIPEDQIKISDLYEVGAGALPMSIPDWKKLVYKSEEYRKSDKFKQRGLGDLTALLKTFNIGSD